MCACKINELGSEKMYKLPLIVLAAFAFYCAVCLIAIKIRQKKKPLRKRNGFERKCRYIFSENAEWDNILHGIK
jgi:hypothetical protein|nr:MAG TPA: hypothetical protein [Caudoviricetes sp.]